ncbi:SIS domain-containing protein, partial [candidate division KSB1 bacterium]
SDGTLSEKARNDGFPVISLPSGYQPRAAVGFSLIPLIRLLAHFRLLPDKTDEILETITLIETLNKDYQPAHSKNSGPFQLAQKILGKLPVIYSGPAPIDALGERFRGQLAENAKVLSHSNILPEMNHNEIMGWDKDFTLTKNAFVVFLRDTHEHERIDRRIRITQEVIERHAAGYDEIWSNGTSALARMMSLLYFCDYASFYLALLNKKDPTVIENINFLKENLEKM